jgi:riboflavin kinase / FMN adenylyltransferase
VLIFSSQSITKIRVPTAIALGNFDGLHLGHQAVIQPVLPPNIDPSLASTLVSFSPHPREFFSQCQRSLLTPLSEKIRFLENIGIKQLVLLDFDRALASLSAAEFIEDILQKKLQAEYISVGFNFHFGAKRMGTVSDLEKIWRDRLHVAQEQLHFPHGDLSLHSQRISSSSIRAALSEGNVNIANKLLGRAYQLIGKVVSGDRLGRELGFPTANLELDPRKFLPRNGVYVVRVQFDREQHLGVMNIGIRPTVGGEAVQKIEVHLLNRIGLNRIGLNSSELSSTELDSKYELYGKELTAELIQFLRPEIKFDSLDALKSQIKIDCQQAIAIGEDLGKDLGKK